MSLFIWSLTFRETVVASSLRIEMAKRNFFMFLIYFTLESETLTLSPNVSNGITNEVNSYPRRTET